MIGKISHQSVGKWNDPASENEDRIVLHDNSIVLSDGAGGTGVFAGEWADYLTKGIHPELIFDAESFKHEILKLKIDFYTQKELFLETETFSYSDKFFIEGSSATLVLVHFDLNLAQARVMSYGDSGFFLYRASEDKLISSVTIDTFMNYPSLLNCKDEEIEETELYSASIPLQKGDFIIVASDAISQWLYMEYLVRTKALETEYLKALENPHSVANYLNEIKINYMQNEIPFVEVLKNCITHLDFENSFKEYTKSLNLQNLLPIDDYTLAIAQID